MSYSFCEKRQGEMRRIMNDPHFLFDQLDLIIVGPGKMYYSWFGHILLKFNNSANNPDEDITLSFLGKFPLDNYNFLKAGFGGYQVLPKLETFSATKDEYFHQEKRYLLHHELKSSSKQKQLLISRLLSWLDNPQLPGTYSFFTNNCLTLMIKLLKDATILSNNLNPHKVLFPNNLQGYLKKENIIQKEYHELP
jgi:hypothetical protein